MFDRFVKPYLWPACKNFVVAFGTIWLFLEAGAGFKWIDTSSFGFWGYLNMALFSLVAAVVQTYLDFARKSHLERCLSQQHIRLPEIIEFHGSYRATDWSRLIGSANREITVCAFYLDSWLEWVKEDLRAFWRKNGTKLRVVLPEIIDDRRLEEIARLFPQYQSSLVQAKITQTKNRIEGILTESELPLNKVEILKYPHFLNYSYVLIDSEFCFLTVYEMERSTKADTFGLILDLRRDTKLRQFVEKENRLVIGASLRS